MGAASRGVPFTSWSRSTRRMTLLEAVRGSAATTTALSTLKRGLRREEMAAWQAWRSWDGGWDWVSCWGRNSTRHSTSRSGPPPGGGTATAAASATPGTPSVTARSNSTEEVLMPLRWRGGGTHLTLVGTSQEGADVGDKTTSMHVDI